MMRAIVQHAYGASDVLSLQDIDEPTPGPHEVLVRVYAASINHGDWFVTSAGRTSCARHSGCTGHGSPYADETLPAGLRRSARR